ncbi:MAG: acyl-CoA reductase [Eubacteriales bacterium]|nr:acyl-CoA reductase [Eubacteriales bacterium]
MRCVIAGILKPNLEMAEALKQTESAIQVTLGTEPLRQSDVIEALNALGERLENEDAFLLEELTAFGLSREQARTAKHEALGVLNAPALRQKCKRELGSPCGEIHRISALEDAFEGNMPLGVLGHVTSGNDAMLPFFSAVEGLLTGNINLVKPAAGAGAVVSRLFTELAQLAPSLAPYLFVLPISSKEEESLRAMLSLCDAVAVWGSDQAVSGVKRLVSPGTRVIEWGHRISFAYVTQRGESKAALEGICKDVCLNDQLACSAPQIVYYETTDKAALQAFATELFQAMERVSPQYPQTAIPKDACAELTQETLLQQMRGLMEDGLALEAADRSFRIYVSYDEALAASPLYRTLLIRPIAREHILTVLRPYRANLQSCAMVCALDEVTALSALLYAAGVNRLTDAGQMGEGYSGEPHDGVYAMSRYVKRVQMRRRDFPWGMMGINELQPQGAEPFPKGTPILKKQDFAGATTIDGAGFLVLKSGGSSGKSVYAPHRYQDAENTYRTAAQSLFAAGLDPAHDIVMNLFYAGDLYGGFISIYEAIKHLGATQLPMCANMDFSQVAKEIAANHANVLCGMSSYLIRLLTEEHDALAAYRGVEKVYYAGEHFDPQQAETLKKQLGIREIRSLTYGCNEIGTMGYACEECKGSVHHLVTDTKYMEILKLDCDKPVQPGEIGRIVVSSCDDSLTVYRYEIGDLGRWVEGDCPCGRKSPRFELLGRFGDVFKFATNYLNAQAIKKILADKMDYHGALQILLDRSRHDYARNRAVRRPYLLHDPRRRRTLSFK